MFHHFLIVHLTPLLPHPKPLQRIQLHQPLNQVTALSADIRRELNFACLDFGEPLKIIIALPGKCAHLHVVNYEAEAP